LYWYSAPADQGKSNLNMLVATDHVGDGKSKRSGAFLQEEFKQRVRGAFLDYYQKNYKANVYVPADDKAEGVSSLDFRIIAFEDSKDANTGLYFWIAFCQRGGQQAAVVFQVPYAKKDEMKSAVEISLKSFALGNAAMEKRNTYRPIRR